jgi:hypothetical protein
MKNFVVCTIHLWVIKYRGLGLVRLGLGLVRHVTIIEEYRVIFKI